MENAAQARTLHTPTFDTFDENPERWIEWPCYGEQLAAAFSS